MHGLHVVDERGDLGARVRLPRVLAHRAVRAARLLLARRALRVRRLRRPLPGQLHTIHLPSEHVTLKTKVNDKFVCTLNKMEQKKTQFLFKKLLYPSKLSSIEEIQINTFS